MNSKMDVLQHPWLTKKRKIMLGALLVFATCSSAYKWSTGGSLAGYSQPTSGSRNGLSAGSWVCEDQYAAAGQQNLIRHNMSQGYRGCYQMGAAANVNVFESTRTTFNGVEVVKVGNSGGVGWVATSDLE